MIGWRLYGALLLLAVCANQLGQAQTAPGGMTGADLTWLKSVSDAAQHHNFLGTIIYQRGEDVRASRVVHAFDANVLHERVLSLDGQPQEYIRDGENVYRAYPAVRRVVFDSQHVRSFPEFAEPISPDVFSHYQLIRQGIDRVAGIACQVIVLQSRDETRYGYRLCVEPRSSLMLKAQTFDEASRLVEQVAFAHIQIDIPFNPVQLKPSWDTSGWVVEHHETQTMQLERKGWTLTPPEGFHRTMQMVRKGNHGSVERNAFQAVYSDGLATVSVFIEPGVMGSLATAQTLRQGPMTAVSRQMDDTRITVIGEVPPVTAQRFASSVRRTSQP